jgi:hypothetical protein
MPVKWLSPRGQKIASVGKDAEKNWDPCILLVGICSAVVITEKSMQFPQN